MKEKITNVILLILAISFLIGMLSGCSSIRVESEESAGSGINDFALQETKQEENIAGDGPLQDYFTLQEELRPAIVQIFCGDYRASGVVWEITDEEVTVMSSAHLLKNAETCEVLCYAGVYYEAKVDRILENCDVGFAMFPAKALKEDSVEIVSVTPCGRSKEELVQGEELMVYGSMDDVAGNFVKGYLLEAEREMQFEGYDSPQHLLLGGIVRESGEEDAGTKEGLVDAGMSGSGVFDRQGKLLGILAGGDGEKGFAAVPVWRIAE